MRHRLSRSRGFSRLPGVEIGSSLCLSGWHLHERAEPEDRELRARGEGVLRASRRAQFAIHALLPIQD